MTDYRDPDDIEELKRILDQMHTLTTTSETIDFINTHLPGWIIGILPSYSADYPHLTNNWNFLCEKIPTDPKKIIIVDQIINEPEYSLLIHLCEFITKNGYVVRRKEELLPCEKCGKALPSEGVYNFMKKMKEERPEDFTAQLPDSWSNTCSSC